MAFPGTYNINYYKGDTFEFSIYPKDSSGEPFLLNDYVQIRFTISNVLGETAPEGVTKVTINGYASKPTNQQVLCAITPENGALMTAGTTYYYDVEIGKISSPYDFVYTLLQGTITVAEQTTPPSTVPGVPQNLTITSLGTTTATVTWDAPAGTAPVSVYNLYPVIGGQPYTPLKATVLSSVNSYVFTGLTPNTAYTLGIKAENVSGEGPMATATGTTLPLES